MSKSAISGSVWAEMSEAQKIESVSTGHATLKEMVEGLLDGPDKLREVCRIFLASSDICREPTELADTGNPGRPDPAEPNPETATQKGQGSIGVAAQGLVMDGARKHDMAYRKATRHVFINTN